MMTARALLSVAARSSGSSLLQASIASTTVPNASSGAQTRTVFALLITLALADCQSLITIGQQLEANRQQLAADR
jgi:hypothetical protein